MLHPRTELPLTARFAGCARGDQTPLLPASLGRSWESRGGQAARLPLVSAGSSGSDGRGRPPSGRDAAAPGSRAPAGPVKTPPPAAVPLRPPPPTRVPPSGDVGQYRTR